VSQKPNIVFIICDDLAWGDLSSHGNPYCRTPELDQLRDQSARLTRYCSGPVCTPARAALFTGRHPYRTRAIDTYLGRSILDPEERTLPELLRERGYATGLFGKWHLGDTYPYRPQDRGFQEALHHAGGGLSQPGNLGRNSYFDPGLWHNGQLVESRGYCTDVFTAAALEFIAAHRAGPFFAFVGFNAPHCPFQIGDEWYAQYRHTDLPHTWQRLYAMVANIDWNVGRLLRRLDELHLADNTLVVFTSDHGPCPSAAVDGKIRYNAGLRGQKSQMYEGGLRVPNFWRWPGHFPAGRTVDRLANPIDILPTLTPPPTDRKIDGRSLLPLLTGESTDWPDRSLCLQWHRGDVPVRGRNAANLRQRWKWYRPSETEPAQLFDIEADPGETRDVAADHPELVATMGAEYDAWFDEVSSTRPDNYAPPPIVIGSPHALRTVLSRQDWRLYSTEEGWSDRHPGFWIVQVERTGTYRLLIDFSSQTTDSTLVVQCGDYSRRIPLPPHLPVYAIEKFPLPAGKHKLEAYLECDGQRVGVKEVHVHS
jgi:arylsulfatase/arylsulfatase A